MNDFSILSFNVYKPKVFSIILNKDFWTLFRSLYFPWFKPLCQTEMECTRTQSKIKGGRSVRRKDIFDVLGKRYKLVLNALSNRNFLCDEETYKKSWKSWFFNDFIPFDCLISSKIICFNAVKIGRSFVKKKSKTPS